MDRQSTAHQNRSQFIESAIRAYLVQLQRAERDASDLAILNNHAERLNAEATDVLRYQIKTCRAPISTG